MFGIVKTVALREMLLLKKTIYYLCLHIAISSIGGLKEG